MIKRNLDCSVCGREVEGDEEIYAKMKAPEKTAMVEIKAYLKKTVKSFVKIVMKNN